MPDTSYGPKVYRKDGGNSLKVASGGHLDVESGGELRIAGTAVTASAAELNITDGLTATAAELNKADGVTGYIVEAQEVTVTETTGAGTYTGSISVPAGAWLLEVALHGVALWDTATSATAKVGDAADDDGMFVGVDLKATDLLAGETLSLAGGTNTAGGKGGADLTATQWNRRYLSTARVISLIVVAVGASGSAGRTRLLVSYILPQASVAATKA